MEMEVADADAMNNLVIGSEKENRIQVSNTKMEVAVADAMNNLVIGSEKKNRIQVSNTKKPLFFYVNLAKRYMQQHDEVELSAMGMAITTAVTIAEILKKRGLAIEKRILLSTVDMKDESKGRLIPKAKIEVLLEKTEKFDDLMAAIAAKARQLETTKHDGKP